MDCISEKVQEFLVRFFKKHIFKVDDDIFSLGFVNSLFAMQLVMFLEKEFKIKIENSDLEMDNFRTINAIVEFVNRKTTAK
jgi:methoxymalonate biosynthesis acyl carrier protein